MESNIKDNVINYLEKFVLSKDSKRDFVRNRSCFSNLLALLGKSHWISWIWFLGRCNLFRFSESLVHCRLIHKLEAHGIGNKLLKWIENRLKGRKMGVIIKCQLSEWRYILSGVPQGQLLHHCYL